MNVAAIRESDWNKDGTVVKVSNVTFDDGREAPGYDLPPGLREGKPLPEGWEIATAKSGKLYIKAPKPGGKGGGFGGGAAAFRNTKEGQAIEQERMDRRTALMQAVASFELTGGKVQDDIPAWADMFYTWLRATSGTPAVPNQPTASTAKVDMGAAAGRAQESVVVGEAAADSCSHDHPAFTYPNGRQVPDGKFYCEDCRKLVKG